MIYKILENVYHIDEKTEKKYISVCSRISKCEQKAIIFKAFNDYLNLDGKYLKEDVCPSTCPTCGTRWYSWHIPIYQIDYSFDLDNFNLDLIEEI